MWIYRDVDKVHDLMDDVAEQQEIANEISDAISNPVGFNTDLDEVSLFAFDNVHSCMLTVVLCSMLVLYNVGTTLFSPGHGIN